MVRVPLVRLRLTSLRVVAVPDPLQGMNEVLNNVKQYKVEHMRLTQLHLLSVQCCCLLQTSEHIDHPQR